MNIELSEKSQDERELPSFKDIDELQMFALTYLNEVHLFLKLPYVAQAQVVGDGSSIGAGLAYCFNTEAVVDFHDTMRDEYKKVKSIKVETGEEFLPEKVIKGLMGAK